MNCAEPCFWVFQVLALVIRPDEGHKSRAAWNRYHHWVGRGAALLAVAEIFIGLQYGDQAPKYSVGAGVVIGTLVLFGAGKEVFDKCARRPATAPAQGGKGDFVFGEMGGDRDSPESAGPDVLSGGGKCGEGQGVKSENLHAAAGGGGARPAVFENGREAYRLPL